MISSEEESLSQEQRIDGYREALSNAGIEPKDEWLVSGEPQYHGGYSEEDGQDAMNRILNDLPDVSAVFCSSDVQAIGALAALSAAGKSAPDDMAIVGYDDIKTSRFIGLSSVDQQIQAIGRAAAECLFDRVSDDSFSTDHQDHVIQPRLAVRRSSMTF